MREWMAHKTEDPVVQKRFYKNVINAEAKNSMKKVSRRERQKDSNDIFDLEMQTLFFLMHFLNACYALGVYFQAPGLQPYYDSSSSDENSTSRVDNSSGSSFLCYSAYISLGIFFKPLLPSFWYLLILIFDSSGLRLPLNPATEAISTEIQMILLAWFVISFIVSSPFLFFYFPFLLVFFLPRVLFQMYTKYSLGSVTLEEIMYKEDTERTIAIKMTKFRYHLQYTKNLSEENFKDTTLINASVAEFRKCPGHANGRLVQLKNPDFQVGMQILKVDGRDVSAADVVEKLKKVNEGSLVEVRIRKSNENKILDKSPTRVFHWRSCHISKWFLFQMRNEVAHAHVFSKNDIRVDVDRYKVRSGSLYEERLIVKIDCAQIWNSKRYLSALDKDRCFGLEELGLRLQKYSIFMILVSCVFLWTGYLHPGYYLGIGSATDVSGSIVKANLDNFLLLPRRLFKDVTLISFTNLLSFNKFWESLFEMPNTSTLYANLSGYIAWWLLTTEVIMRLWKSYGRFITKDTKWAMDDYDNNFLNRKHRQDAADVRNAVKRFKVQYSDPTMDDIMEYLDEACPTYTVFRIWFHILFFNLFYTPEQRLWENDPVYKIERVIEEYCYRILFCKNHRSYHDQNFKREHLPDKCCIQFPRKIYWFLTRLILIPVISLCRFLVNSFIKVFVPWTKHLYSSKDFDLVSIQKYMSDSRHRGFLMMRHIRWLKDGSRFCKRPEREEEKSLIILSFLEDSEIFHCIEWYHKTKLQAKIDEEFEASREAFFENEDGYLKDFDVTRDHDAAKKWMEDRCRAKEWNFWCESNLSDFSEFTSYEEEARKSEEMEREWEVRDKTLKDERKKMIKDIVQKECKGMKAGFQDNLCSEIEKCNERLSRRDDMERYYEKVARFIGKKERDQYTTEIMREKKSLDKKMRVDLETLVEKAKTE